jgi:hypothetical protein
MKKACCLTTLIDSSTILMIERQLREELEVVKVLHTSAAQHRQGVSLLLLLPFSRAETSQQK